MEVREAIRENFDNDNFLDAGVWSTGSYLPLLDPELT